MKKYSIIIIAIFQFLLAQPATAISHVLRFRWRSDADGLTVRAGPERVHMATGIIQIDSERDSFFGIEDISRFDITISDGMDTVRYSREHLVAIDGFLDRRRGGIIRDLHFGMNGITLFACPQFRCGDLRFEIRYVKFEPFEVQRFV